MALLTPCHVGRGARSGLGLAPAARRIPSQDLGYPEAGGRRLGASRLGAGILERLFEGLAIDREWSDGFQVTLNYHYVLKDYLRSA